MIYTMMSARGGLNVSRLQYLLWLEDKKRQIAEWERQQKATQQSQDKRREYSLACLAEQ